MNVAIIQARLNSQRFPNKVLAEICGKPMLLHVIERVKQAKLVDRVIVAAPRDGGGATIRGYCEEWGHECMVTPHPQDNVLGRITAVAEKVKADLVVRVCADNPMINPAGIDELLEVAMADRLWQEQNAKAAESAGEEREAAFERERKPDYTGYRAADGSPMILRPSGWFAEVVPMKTLRVLDRYLSAHSAAREHVTQPLYDVRMGMLQGRTISRICWLDLPAWYIDNKLPNTAIDRPEDIEELESWLAEFDNEENWPWK